MTKHPHPRQEPDFSSNHGDDQDKIELPREKKVKNNLKTEADSSSANSCFLANDLDTDYLPQDFTGSDSLKRKCRKNYCPRIRRPRRKISSYSSREKQFVTFILAPVDVRLSRLRLPIQFTRDNGINQPGKIHLRGKDGSKCLANLYLESSGGFTLGGGWKSFVKSNGLKTGESFTLELIWEDTVPILCLCPAQYSIDRRAEGECSGASENESPAIEPSSENEVIKDENNKEESSSWKREKNHLGLRDSTSPSQNRFLTVTITPDTLKYDRLRLPLQFMRVNNMDTPGEITLLGKDGSKWLVSLLLEKSGRMVLGKGWKEFSKANSLKAGNSITLESIWEEATPVLSLLCIESPSARRRQGECSKSSEKETNFTGNSSENKTRKAESNREDSRRSPLGKRDSSFVTIMSSPEIVCRDAHDPQTGESVVFRHEGDKMFQVSDLRPSSCEVRDILAPSSNNDQDNIGGISINMHPHLRKETGFSSYDGDDQENIEFPRKKKMKNDTGTKVESSPEYSCFAAHVTDSYLHTDALYLSQDLASSNGLKAKCLKRHSPRPIISSCSSSDLPSVTLRLSPVDAKNCRLRLPMQFTRVNGINKPGKIYLLGKDGSKSLVNLFKERNGRVTLGNGWKIFVKANSLRTGESFTLKLTWEDTIPVLSLCHVEYSIDCKTGGECSEASETEFLPIEPSSERKIIKEESKEDDNSWGREKNHMRWIESTSPSQNRFLTLAITHDCVRYGRLRLPLQFMKENSMNKPGEIILLGKDGSKWLVSLLLERRRRMSLGKGWQDFAKANGLKTGDSITLESSWDEATPVLSLIRIESSNDRGQSEISKESLSTESNSGNKTMETENNREESSLEELEKSRDSSSAIQNRMVTLTLTPEHVRDCELHLPSQFLMANGVNKLGRITLLGKTGMKWFAYLLSKDGILALGNGWKVFCEANGVKLGESFTLEFIGKEDTDHVFKFCSNLQRPNT